MKKIFAVLLALTMVLALASCGAGKTDPSASPEASEAPKEVTLSASEVIDALKAQLGDSYTCTVVDTPDDCSRYGLDSAKVESFASECHAVSSVNMDSVLVFKVQDGYANDTAAALQKLYDQKIGYARLYNMDLFRMNEARLFIQGNYVALLIIGQRSDAEDAETQAAFAAEEAKKIDAAWQSIFGVSTENILVIPEPDENGNGGMQPGKRPGGVVPRGSISLLG